MLRALHEAGIRPDIVVGTSIGAVNGAFVAADPDLAADRLGDLWRGESLGMVFSETVLSRAVRLARSGTHLHAIEPLRGLLGEKLSARDFTDLALPFHCVAASIENATARWFSSGPLLPAVMASCAVPACCLRSRSTVPTTSMAASSTPSPSAARSRSAPAPSTCCTWAGLRARCPFRRGPGRWASSRSRSRAGTASTRRCRRFRPAFRSMSCQPAASNCRPVFANSVTAAENR